MMNGRCMCGAVTLKAQPARESLSACHCDMCRRWCSGPFVAFEAVSETLHVDGPIKRMQTSDWAERAVCAECGSALWYHMTDEPGRSYNLAAGLFDTGAMPISIEVWIDEKPEGYALAGERRQMTGAEVLAFFGAED